MEETKVIGSRISSEMFFYNKETATFSQEASSLPKTFNPESQIWNDSADCGFVMVGQKTSKEMIFFFKGIDRSSENEIQAWRFEADPIFNKKLISKPVSVIIWND